MSNGPAAVQQGFVNSKGLRVVLRTYPRSVTVALSSMIPALVIARASSVRACAVLVSGATAVPAVMVVMLVALAASK